MTHVKNWLFALALAFILSASANFTYAQTSTSYTHTSLQQAVSVQTGRILQIRKIELDASSGVKATGGVVGGALGALLGSRVAHNNNSNGYILASALGAMGATGGVVTASQFASPQAFEYVIQMDDNRVIAVAQSAADGITFHPGQKIYYLNGRIAPLVNHPG